MPSSFQNFTNGVSGLIKLTFGTATTEPESPNADSSSSRDNVEVSAAQDATARTSPRAGTARHSTDDKKLLERKILSSASPSPQAASETRHTSSRSRDEERRRWSTQIEQAKRDAENIQKERAEDRKRYRQDLERAGQDLRREQEARKRLHASAQQKVEDLSMYQQSLEEQIKRLRAELAQEKEQHQSTTIQLEARTREWHSAQTYLVSSDSLSGAEVASLSKELNDEIYQLSSSIIDWFSTLDHQPRHGNVDLTDAASLVGNHQLVALLVTYRESGDALETILQTTIAAALLSPCATYLALFATDQRTNAYLCALYAKIQATDLPSVAGRWRAITRAKSKEDTPNDKFVAALAQAASTILQICTAQEILTFLIERFTPRLVSLTKMVKKFDQVIGEGFTSQDLSVIIPPANADFDPSQMEDENEDPRARKAKKQRQIVGHVVCTTGFGLKISTRSKNAEGKWEVHHQVLQRARVVIDTNTPWDEDIMMN